MTNPSLQNMSAVTRTSVIRIHRYDGRNPQGVLYNRQYETEQPFDNLMQLLILLDTTAAGSRIAAEEPVVCWNHPGSPKTLATFQIQLLFQEHSEWQGYLSWTEGRQTRAFRGVLELVKLIDDALASKAEPQYEACEAVDAG